MSLPQLRSASVAPARDPDSLAYSDSSLSTDAATSAPAVSRDVHLPALTATSLRPARQRRSIRTPSSLMDEPHGTPFPLLETLLQHHHTDTQANALPPSSATQQLVLPSLQEAIAEVGGEEQVEALLRRLGSLDAASSPTQLDEVGSAVLRCVEEVLQLPPGAVDVVGVDVDPAIMQVCIPLHTCAAPTGGSGGGSGDGGGGAAARPCLVLRLHRQRGVLALHVIDLRYQGPQQRTERRAFREPAVVKRRHAPHTRRSLSSTAVSRGPSGLLASFAVDVRTQATTKAPVGAAAHSSPRPSITHAQLSSELRRPTVAGSGTVASPPVSMAASFKPLLSTASSKDAASTVGRTQRAREGRKTHSVPPPRRHAAMADQVEFDPLHPEQTTPFNAQHRPLTFNAALAFS